MSKPLKKLAGAAGLEPVAAHFGQNENCDGRAVSIAESAIADRTSTKGSSGTKRHLEDIFLSDFVIRSRSERWITIGTVKTNHSYYMGGSCVINGLWMGWRGRVDWCQPLMFPNWGELIKAVRVRAQIAKLEAVAVASQVDRLGQHMITLRVLVRRAKF